MSTENPMEKLAKEQVERTSRAPREALEVAGSLPTQVVIAHLLAEKVEREGVPGDRERAKAMGFTEDQLLMSRRMVADYLRRMNEGGQA